MTNVSEATTDIETEETEVVSTCGDTTRTNVSEAMTEVTQGSTDDSLDTTSGL